MTDAEADQVRDELDALYKHLQDRGISPSYSLGLLMVMIGEIIAIEPDAAQREIVLASVAQNIRQRVHTRVGLGAIN